MDENKGRFVLVRSLRVVSSMIVLECTLLTSYTVFCLRASFLNEISQEVSLILSVMTIFVASSESQLTTKIENPSSLVLAGLIFKSIKAVMTIIIFTMNGTINDYFVSVFFFSTSLCGLVYLQKCGYNYPLKPKDNENQVYNLRCQIEKDIISKE